MALYRWFLENLINPHSVSAEEEVLIEIYLEDRTEHHGQKLQQEDFKIEERWNYHMTWTQNNISIIGVTSLFLSVFNKEKLSLQCI